jgi:2-polyprenyl-3-methyl-5-hydroxy-6-metoxy-1,4-benzoquinol methylase
MAITGGRIKSTFTRSDETYAVDPQAVDRILADPINPLNRIASVVPEGATVLDIGAGNGLLASVLSRTHERITVDGIEPNQQAAEIARASYRHLWTGYAQDLLGEIESGGYDFLVLADVIEHTSDPVAFLRELVDAAPEGARILLSVPNVAFAAVRLALLHGDFAYVDSGLLERTHLRFFTLETLEETFEQVGLTVERRVLHKKSAFSSEIPLRPSLLDLVVLARLRRDPLAATYQFFFVLAKRDAGSSAAQPVLEEYGGRTTFGEMARHYAAAKLRRGAR